DRQTQLNRPLPNDQFLECRTIPNRTYLLFYFHRTDATARSAHNMCAPAPKLGSPSPYPLLVPCLQSLAPSLDLARRSPRRRHITLHRVIHHHAVSVEPPPQRANRP